MLTQMMFVFGEVRDSLDETTSLIEEITRSQLIEMINLAVQNALKRGTKHLAVDDLLFVIRNHKEKLGPLINFLSWKEVRKNAKDKGEVDEDLVAEEGLCLLFSPISHPETSLGSIGFLCRCTV